MPTGLLMLGVSHPHAYGNARAAAEVEQVNLIALCDPDTRLAQQRREEWADFLPDLQVIASPDEAVVRSDIQGVIVDGPVTGNLALASMALEAGKHVLLEKPAGLDYAQFQRLHDLAARRNLVLQMGYIMRYNAGFELAQRLVCSGALGRVVCVRGRISWEVGGYEAHLPTIADLPGGMLCELGCHFLDLIIILLGAPQRAQAFLGSHHDPTGRHTDNALAVLEYEHAFASIETCAMESGAFANRSFEVYGTGGTVVIKPFEPPRAMVHLEQPHEKLVAGWQEVSLHTVARHVQDLREFAACISGQKTPTYPPAHDLLVQRTLLTLCGAA